MQYLSDGEGPWTEQQTEQLTDSYNDVKRSLTGYRLSGAPPDQHTSRGVQRPPRRLQNHGIGAVSRVPSGGARVTVHDSTLKVLFDGGLRDAVGAAKPDGGHLPRMDKAVYGHFGDTHYLSHLGHGQELGVREVRLCGHYPYSFALSNDAGLSAVCVDAEPSNNRVLVTLDAHVAIVKARRFRDDAASCSRTDAVTSHSMQASVTLWP